MTNEGQGKTGFSRADLLWGMFATVADSEARKQLALSLGFELEHGVVEDTQKKALPSQQQTALPADETRLEEEVKDTAVTEPQTTATTASYYRITGRKREEQEAGSEQEDIGQLPDWFAEASPTILVEAGSRIPMQHRVFPLHTELTRWSRLEPFLKKMLGARVAGVQVDTVRLVKQVAEGESIQRIPRKEHHGWAADLCLLIDINSYNFPYRRDFIQLREKLLQVRGVEGLDVQYVLDEPGGYVTRYQHQHETVELWRTPARETPLLILSDLGMHAASQRPLYAWLVFGQLLKAQGIRPVVLMPVAERDMDKRLFNYFDCYEWDGTSDLKRVKGSYQSETDPRNHADSIEVLLGYFFATVRVDSGLLRAIRYLIPGEPDSKQPLRFHPLDIGHETAVWRHHATLQEGDEWGWKSGSKENYLPSAVKLLKILKLKKRQQLVELIGRYHATYPDELYFEAIYNLMLLEDQDAGLAGLVPDAIRSATDQYMADLAKTFAENPLDNLLGNWVKRHLERHQAENIRKKHKYWLAFMAFARLHQEQREGKAEVPYPDFLTQADIAEISRYINHAKAFRRYQLKQQGEKLVLVLQDDAGKAKQAADDWGKSTVSGALLLNLSLNDERIFHIHTDSRGNQKNVSLNLDKIKDGFNFPANGKHEFQIGQERFTVDVSTAQQQKEPWMKFIASGSDGLYAESQTNAGDIYRWYWHPPEWSRDKGILPGTWYGSKQLDEAQRDTFGFYTDITIAGIPQRFRWIEPTAFQMGEENSQHQVILTQGYWLAETACTQSLWQVVMGDNPSSFKDEKNPVENVSWQDVTDKFLKQVNKQYPQLKLRLPTEAEWENACRAGTSSPYAFGDEITKEQANFNASRTAKVKSYPPNQWGLYEMHGNVWEWCLDWYGSYPAESVIDPQGSEKGSHRVLRGGSWYSYGGGYCRSAHRHDGDSGRRTGSIGFRLALGHELSPVRLGRTVQPPSSARKTADKSILDRIKDTFKR